MKRLNGMDAMLLYSETPNLHTHTLKVAVIDPTDLDGEFGFDVFRYHLRRRLHLLEPLRYKLVDIPWRLHHPMWQENCEVDLDYHLRRVHVPAPGGRRELDRLIGELASTPLDRSRPLWEFHFAEGLAGGRFALIGKVHHALADGVASVNLLARAMDLRGGHTDERDNDEAGVTTSDADLLRAAARDHVRQLAQLPRLVKDAAVGLMRVRRRSRLARRPPRPGRRLRCTTHLSQPCRLAPAVVRQHVVAAAAGQSDGKSVGHHHERSGADDSGGRVANTLAGL